MATTPAGQERYIGSDLHKHFVVFCIIDAAGTVLQRHQCACRHEELERFGQRYFRPTDRLALEATTNTWEVVRILKPFVAEVVVSNPLKTRAIAEAKIKTDKVDALVLAQLLRCDFLPRVWEPPAATQHRPPAHYPAGGVSHGCDGDQESTTRGPSAASPPLPGRGSLL